MDQTLSKESTQEPMEILLLVNSADWALPGWWEYSGEGRREWDQEINRCPEVHMEVIG